MVETYSLYTCYENYITIGHDQSSKLVCHLCHVSINVDNVAVLEHINSKNHQDQMKNKPEKCLNINNTLSDSILKLSVLNHITFDYKNSKISYYCHCCNIVVPEGLLKLIGHIKGNNHQLLKNPSFEFEENEKVKQEFKCKTCNLYINGKENIFLHGKSELHVTNLMHTNFFDTNKNITLVNKINQTSLPKNSKFKGKCKLCQMTIKSESILKIHGMIHINDKMDPPLDIIKVQKKTRKSVNYCMKCYLCNTFVASHEDLHSHLESMKHKNFLKLFQNKIKSFNSYNKLLKTIQITDKVKINQLDSNFHEYIVKACQSNGIDVPMLVGDSAVKSYEDEKKHKENLKNINLQGISNDLSDLVQGFFYCFLCQLFFSSSLDLLEHFTSKPHLFKVLCLHKINNDPDTKLVFQKEKSSILCKLCDISCDTGLMALDHIKGKKHGKKTKSLNVDDLEISFKTKVFINEKSNNPSTKKLKPIINYKILFENCIAKLANDNMFCYLCNFDIISGDKETVNLHIKNSANHKTKNNLSFLTDIKGCPADVNFLIQSKCKKFVDNGIVFKKNKYVCYFCQKKFGSLDKTESHINTFDHKAQLFNINHSEKFNSERIVLSDKLQSLNSNMKNSITPSVSENSSINKHELNSKEIISEKSKKEKKPPIRILCGLKKKEERAKKIYNSNDLEKIETELNELEVPELSTETSLDPSSSNDIDIVLDDLIDMGLRRNQVPRKKLREPKFNSEKNMFDKNVKDHGKSYISFCIDAGKQNIYNLDQTQLDLLKSGINLTFEQSCILCGIHFPNEQLLFEHLKSMDHIKELMDAKNNDEEFENHRDQFSDLELAKHYMQEEDSDLIYCYACDSKIKNDDLQVHSHIQTSGHVQKSEIGKIQSEAMIHKYCSIFENLWYYTEIFFCQICKKKYSMEIDFVIHLRSFDHWAKMIKLSKNKIGLDFNFCHVCRSYWYGESNFFDEHCKDNFHKRFCKNGDFNVPDMNFAAENFLTDVNEKMDVLIFNSDKVQLQESYETRLIEDIIEIVKHDYLNAKAYPFGSRISSLGFPESDLDIFLDCNNVYFSGINKVQSEEYLIKTQKLFENKKKVWVVEESLRVTRVPILKLLHLPTGLKCDISFMNGLGVEKSSLIGYYNTAYPTCRKMILYLKKWLNFCQLSGCDNITTFAISWYVIFYFQVEGILPSVNDLIRRKNESKIVNGWECGVLKEFVINNSDSCLKHLIGFFKYYAHFDYKLNVACPLLGKAMKKSIFTDIETLPDEMNIYKLNLTELKSEYFRIDSPMCIQDPIELSQNITKAVKKLKLQRFIKYCYKSAETLEKFIN